MTRATSNLALQLKEKGYQKVKVSVTDIDGVLRGKYIHIDKFISACEKGFGFCNVVLGWDSSDVVYDNCTYTGWHTGYPDALVRIDLDTHRSIPWDHGTPFFLGEFQEAGGRPLAICPRQVLKSVLARAKALGFLAIVGSEYEWFNFREDAQSLNAKGFRDPQPLTPGMFGYSLLRSGANREYFHDLSDRMREFRIPIEGIHTETGPGVYEAAIQCSDALEAADRAVLFKSGTKEIAAKYGIVASFMARWNTTLPGCSGHLHQSLTDLDGKGLFYDANDPHKMSALFKSYLAGQILCLPTFLPMMAPTVNSYKRLVEGYWAPTSATWGIDNRTCALRVLTPYASAARVEVRIPGADMNPYLAIAATIAAGLYGIEHKLPLSAPPVVGNGYQAHNVERFPPDLGAAALRFGDAKLAKDTFGAAFVQHFAHSRTWEWRQYQKAVTDWELKRYFEII